MDAMIKVFANHNLNQPYYFSILCRKIN